MSRVLMLTQCFPPHIGGIENCMHGLAESLAASGRQVTVFADGRMNGAPSAHPFALHRFYGYKPLRRRVKAWAAAWKIMKSAESMLLIADSWKSLEHLPPASARRCRVVCFLHGMEFPAAPTPQKTRRIEAALAKADALCANSHYTAALARPYIKDESRLHIITPCIATPPAATEDALRRMEERLGFGAPLLATVCRLEPRKGIDQVIKALLLLRQQFPRITYAVGGAGEDTPRLKALAEELGLSAQVHFLGRVSEEDKAALLHRADIFVMPVRQEGNSVEGFGTAYIEAGWYGRPSVAGLSGGASEAVEDGITGTVCRDISPEAFANAITPLLTDADLAARLGTAARFKAQSLTWEKGLGRYLEVFGG